MDRLEAEGELLRIDREVSCELEIAAIADRVSRAGPEANKALLFTQVAGSRFPVLINALGSSRRMQIACGVEDHRALENLLEDFLQRIERPRVTWRDKFGALPLLGRLARLFPRHVRNGPCQEVVHEGGDVDLLEVPVLTTWPKDAGPFVTLPLVFTKDPETGARNCGMYRLQRYDENTFGFHVHTHHTGADHLRKAKALGREHLEVAVAVGASAATVFSAVAPLPPGVDELLFAAFIQNQPVDLVKCRTVDLEVPAAAEFVIEGRVPVDELRREGPFGDHTGFYSLADDYHVLNVTALTHRRDAIWHTTVVGPPPQEDCHMGAAIERLFIPLQRKLMPELIDMRLPFAGVFHNLMLLKVRKDYPGQGRKVAHTVWGMGQAMFTKVIVVVDEDGPALDDDAALLDLLLERFDSARDLEFVFGPTETLDHASRALHFGSKACIDLTREFPAEGPRRTVADAAQPSEAIDDAELVAVLRELAGVEDALVIRGRAGGAGAIAVGVDKAQPSVPRVTMEQIWDLGERRGFQAITDRILLFDKNERLDDNERLLWRALAHIEPERDVQRSPNPVHDASLRRSPGYHPRRIGIDATTKKPSDGFQRDWPTEQTHPKKLLNRIANHWTEMGLAGECP